LCILVTNPTLHREQALADQKRKLSL
jgi:hypothetical protein